MAKEIITDLFDCEECNAHASVKVIHTTTSKTKTVDVKKCTNCKHQYGFKQICKMAEHQDPLTSKTP